MQMQTYADKVLLTKDTKRTFEENYLRMLFEKHRALPQSDIIEFIHKSQQTGANPSLNQIYLIERNTKVNGEWRKVGSVVFSYNFILAIANQTKEFQGYTSEMKIVEKFDPMTLESKKMLACTTITRRNNSEFPYTAYFDEYVQTDREGKPQGLWASKPYMMLEKCSISGALRRAFPEALSGIYCEEELESASNELDKKIQNDFVEVKAEKEVQKKIEVIEKVNAIEEGELDAVLSVILNALAQLTNGMTAKDKAKAMFELCSVNKFNDLKNKTMNELKAIAEKLDSILAEKLLRNSENMEVKNV